MLFLSYCQNNYNNNLFKKQYTILLFSSILLFLHLLHNNDLCYNAYKDRRMIYIKKRVILIIALLSLLYCISSIVTTYSKYVSKATGEFIANIAKWDIKVNDEQITTNSLHTVEITPTFAGNENLKEGVIAPTAVGYFDIIIDATNVDVSFNYEITISENAEIPDLKIKSFERVSEKLRECPLSPSSWPCSYGPSRRIRSPRAWGSSARRAAPPRPAYRDRLSGAPSRR